MLEQYTPAIAPIHALYLFLFGEARRAEQQFIRGFLK
jgi:hypothetical protein